MRRILAILVLSLLSLLISCNKMEDSETKSNSASSDFQDGDKFPDISLTGVNGENVRIRDYLKEGPVLLNLWATWCTPCVEEMVDLIELHNSKLGNPPLRILAINMDSSSAKQEVLDFIKNKNINFSVLLDPEWTTIETLKIKGYPETFLIDQKGEFREFLDPELRTRTTRILSKREWNSEEMKSALCDALKSCN